ncbi:pyridoxal phosphate-dependent aminotransferase family protein [Frankia sp. QA3]|uniref:aminotransferase class I/II-fold pyridoxal phosphate-dependent enzyme n=1 Tax=Frankia sp. QA3 TaxID=710111 RepID=UPI000269CEBF|nr:pyridoxal phosphate-dependent aminotransferase family protein [Frankia sp. QA3]EIV95793.1 7-keto-8-aminopelargonate synthetase-like enzyme [Frankia sp. QA3]
MSQTFETLGRPVPPAPGAFSPAWRHVLDRPLGMRAELDRMRRQAPFYDATVDEIDGRRIRIGDHWLTDFASCNYLGLDLDREIIDAVPAYLDLWGTHPSWSRLIASPRPYDDIERTLAELLGAEDALLLPTITHIQLSVLPALVGRGALFVELHAHQTAHDGAAMVASHGGTVARFREDRLDRLERRLRTAPHPRVICVDGVHSMTGNGPPLAELLPLARAHDALLYVDDAHGFGVVGERGPDESSPYGSRGNGIVRHLGASYDNLVLVGGFSKAYSSLLAFVACPTEVKEYLKSAAGPYIFSGPSPVASLATGLVGLRVNEQRGEALRARLHRLTSRFLDGLRGLGLATLNTSGFPIVEIPLTDPDHADPLGRFLYERGVFASVVPFPVVPRDQVGVRVQITAANTDDEIDHLLAVLAEAGARFPLVAATSALDPG